MKMPPLADGRSILSECQTCTAVYSQGLETFRVPMSLYELNRSRVVHSMNVLLDNNNDDASNNSKKRGLILLQGGKQLTRYDTDHEPEFRQESYFHYLFGASQYPDCYGTLSIPEGIPSLFVPTWGVDTEMFCGPCPNFEYVKEELGIRNVYGVEELEEFLEKELKRMSSVIDEVDDGGDEHAQSAPKLFLLKGLNTDSGNFAVPATFGGIDKYNEVRDEDTLFPCIAECRVIKVSFGIWHIMITFFIIDMIHPTVPPLHYNMNVVSGRDRFTTVY
jgi:Xaa-Pro dipeptidase